MSRFFARSIGVLVGLALLALPLASPGSRNGALAQDVPQLLVYHQITNYPDATGSLGYPVLSGDGTTGVFTNAPGSGDPATPNRIFTIKADGSGMTEVDSYTTLCYCSSLVDISNDGSVVVSTEGVQVRIADGSGARELLRLASGEITSLVITGNSQTVYFLVRRDTSTSDNAILLPRGIWAIDADGENLRQVIDASDVAGALSLPVDQTGCCFHGDGHPLDASDDGSRIVFAAFAGTGEHFFSADGNGGNIVKLGGDMQYAMRVAISGDGALAAYDGTPSGATLNEVAVLPAGGGTPHVLTTMPYSGFDEPFQLSQTGARLLISSNGLLVDTATGDSVLLGVSINGVGGNHEAVLTDGLPRGTMDANAQTFLYVMRTVRCADCPNRQEQLATLALDPIDLGDAPFITDTSIEPPTIALDHGSEATVVATVDADGQVLGVGFAAMLDGAVDPNVSAGLLLFDDGTNGDSTAGDGIYTNSAITHAFVVARDDDTGPRVVRIAAEVEGADGRRHATAVDIGTLVVEDGADGV